MSLVNQRCTGPYGPRSLSSLRSTNRALRYQLTGTSHDHFCFGPVTADRGRSKEWLASNDCWTTVVLIGPNGNNISGIVRTFIQAYSYSTSIGNWSRCRDAGGFSR
jgi:hypothetical protein